MNKFYLTLLLVALIGFAAAVDREDHKIMLGYKLLAAAKAIDNEDFYRVDWFKSLISDENQWKHLEPSEALAAQDNIDKWGHDTANYVRAMTAAVMYVTQVGKSYPETDITTKEQYMAQLGYKLVEPCERVVKRLDPFVTQIKNMEHKGNFKFEFGGMAKAWLERFDACEVLVYEGTQFGNLSYEVAQKNNLL